MNEYIHSTLFQIAIALLFTIVSVYFLGRAFVKGGLHEFDKYIGKKLNKFTKLKKDGTTKKEESL